MICVLIASLLECFIVLPAHLRHAFTKAAKAKGQALINQGDRHSSDEADERDRHSSDERDRHFLGHSRDEIQRDRHSSEDAPFEGQAPKREKAPGPLARFRAGFEQRFDHFRHGPFRRFSRYTLKHRGLTLASALAVVILTVGLLAGGRLGFNFFPTPEPTVLYANASFVAGTHRDRVNDFLGEMQQALNDAEAELGGGLVRRAITSLGSTQGAPGGSRSSDELGSILVELTSSDARTVRNPAFVTAWRDGITLPAGLDNLIIAERQTGPPGQDINVRLTGGSAMDLKQAAESLAQAMKTLPGILDTEDDMPWGREQLIYQLSPQGEALGLTTESLGRQLRAAFDGRIAQIYQDGRDEVEVRVQLPRDQRESMGTLSRLSIQVPDGRFVPLTQVMHLDHRQGFQSLRHAEGQLAVEVSASLDTSVSTAADIIASLEQDTLPTLARDFGLSYSFEGRSADQRETLRDMRTGLLVGLALMYVVLTWVFGSWSLPLIVMAIIPFALVGALIGHWLMGLQLTILSLFGLFGLSGIVVNSAIILITFYRQQRDAGLSITDALNEAAVQRMRAVLLTSLTTIGGLLPLLFETSLQAQFLIPMATSIAFGLGFSTLLVLVVIPVLLSYLEQFHSWRERA
ncbi:MAG: efflux RND transporter permease subunit [Halomonadaceae bacterium]|nr:MAG: efflux RND transporter permease subunit [Halomonadaceae bacterium]